MDTKSKYVLDIYTSEAGKKISIGFICSFFGIIAGAYMADKVHQKYTNKDQVLSFPKTEITVNHQYEADGKSIVQAIKVPARIVPDSLLNNIQPR